MNQNERKQESRQEQIENMTTRRDMSRMTLYEALAITPREPQTKLH